MNDTFIMRHVLMGDVITTTQTSNNNSINTTANNNSNNNSNVIINDVVFLNPTPSLSLHSTASDNIKIIDTNVKEKKHRDYDRKLWNPTEDEALQRLVDKNGTQSWTHIAELLNNQFQLPKPRTAKQCRERWHGHLDPSKFINKSAFTPEEEQKLLELQRELGSKWAEIARRLPGRTDNNCKNHWYSYMRKQNRQKGELAADIALLNPQPVQQLTLQNVTQVNNVKQSLLQDTMIEDTNQKIPIDSDSEDEDDENKDGSLKKRQKL